MRITKWTGLAAALLSIAPIGISAQGSGARKTQAKPAVVRSDVRELPADQQIIHALSRLTFGAKSGDALKVRTIGLDNWIEQQLGPDKIDDSAIEGFVSRYSVLNQDQNSLLQQYAQQQRERQQVRRDRADSTRVMSAADSIAMRQQMQQQQANLTRQVVTELQSSRVARAVASERQLQEVMTDFWENHFNIYAQKGGPEVYYLTDFDENVIRPHALGKFRDLLEAVAKSPAMLFYLDNAQSMADSSRPTLAARNGGPIRVMPMGKGGIGAAMGAMRAAQEMQRQRQQQQQQLRTCFSTISPIGCLQPSMRRPRQTSVLFITWRSSRRRSGHDPTSTSTSTDERSDARSTYASERSGGKAAPHRTWSTPTSARSNVL